MCAQNSVVDLSWQSVFLVRERQVDIALGNLRNKLIKLLTKMVGSFLRHFGWEMVDTVEENAVVVEFFKLLFEFSFDSVPK